MVFYVVVAVVEGIEVGGEGGKYCDEGPDLVGRLIRKGQLPDDFGLFFGFWPKFGQ